MRNKQRHRRDGERRNKQRHRKRGSEEQGESREEQAAGNSRLVCQFT